MVAKCKRSMKLIFLMSYFFRLFLFICIIKSNFVLINNVMKNHVRHG